jgi:AP-3 complex subunit beta
MEEAEKPFYESFEKEDEEEEEEEGGKGDTKTEKKAPYIMDPDHRLLLRQAKPLLNSRNSAVST